MRNLVLAIVGLGVVAVALPVASANAEDTVVIKKIGITIATGTDTTIVTGIGITTRKL